MPTLLATKVSITESVEIEGIEETPNGSPSQSASLQLRVGVVGYGYWGPNMVRNVAEHPGATVVAVSDLRPERLAVAYARYPALAVTTDSGDLLRDRSIDAIIITTPVATHFDLAMSALRQGKHVLVSKPLVSRAIDATRLIDQAAQKGLTLMVDHTFIYTGAVRKIKELVDEKQLGQLYYYDSVRINLGLFQSDVNVLWDLAVHDLAIMDYVLGVQPRAVTATGAAHIAGHPANVAYLTCFFEENLIAHHHVNWLSPVKVRRTLIGGDRQMIVYDDLEPSEKVKVYDKGVTITSGETDRIFESLVGYRTGDMWAPKIALEEGLSVEIGHFIDCIRQGRQPLSDGQAGLRVVRILEAAAQSMDQRGRLVELEGLS